MFDFTTQSVQRLRIDYALMKEEVNLQNKKILDAGMKYLCEKDTSKVQRMKLQHNIITEMGAFHFRLAKWSSLTQLWLERNSIGNRGCKYLSMAFLDKLQLLNLRQNELGSPGVLHLAKLQWKVVKEIHLSSNNICSNSIIPITKANWKHLNHISLYDNRHTAAQSLKIILLEAAIQKVGLGIICAMLNKVDKLEQQAMQKFIAAKFGQITISVSKNKSYIMYGV